MHKPVGPAALLRALRRCPVSGHRLGRRRVALTIVMPTAVFHAFVGWPPRRNTQGRRGARVPRGKRPPA